MSAAHLSSDALWDAAKGELVGEDYAHLQLCPDCREQLENIKLAQGVLVEPPPPPPLSDASAKRIGDVLRKAAEEQARSSLWWASWWPFNWSPTWVLAPVAAALLAFVAYRVTGPIGATPGETPSPIAKRDEPVRDAPGPTPPPMPEAPRPLPVKKVLASVKRTKGAKSGDAVLKKAQSLSEGSTVATAKGGELLMALPDGSQIALASASQVQLAKLEDKAVALDVDKGTLKVVARHDSTRELRVRAGDLEVFDVGTEFIVSREGDSTLVAVEEGEVEVKAAGETVPLKAGQAVQYRGGKLERQQWATAEELPKPRPRPVAVAQAPVAPTKKATVEETPDIPSEPQKATPPAPAPVPAPEEQPKPAEPDTVSQPDEWSTPENLRDAPVAPPPPPPVPAPEPKQQAPTAQPEMAPPSEAEEDNSVLGQLSRTINKVGNAFKQASRGERALHVKALTDALRCNDAIAEADRWLGEAVPKGESFNLRRGVLSSKKRCLDYLGRSAEAAAVQRDLDKL
ncbi:MAG: FecR domain-containing protein [Myxococcaceae bacterium]|nr:FecR domain-containing protein [Myxococcaceae bacterium]